MEITPIVVVDVDYIRMLADDLEESGSTATAEDFRACADEIERLRDGIAALIELSTARSRQVLSQSLHNERGK